MSRFPEDDLQIQVARYLDLRGWLWNHCANERKTTPQAGARLKLKGVRSGVPDVMIYEYWETLDEWTGARGFGVAIELKAGKNKPTANQRAWLEALEARGWRVAVCYSLDEVVEVCSCLK